MRISVGELWQKRLLAAGFPRVFEIGRVYRNEGSSPEHLQEFTSMEFYASFMDYNEGMSFTEGMIKEVVQKTFGTLLFTKGEHTFDLSGAWERVPYVETIEKMTGVNVLSANETDMESKLSELGVKYEGKNRERLTDTLWKYCRKQLTGPLWLVDVPKIVSPLAKAKKDNPLLTERAQLILAGAECTNGFSELNDPEDQAERFKRQVQDKDAGDQEAMHFDADYIRALEYGLPPTAGEGIGIDRLVMLLTDSPSIRDVLLFPHLRPE
jgi:lysyl-tRNA synthetase class 2